MLKNPKIYINENFQSMYTTKTPRYVYWPKLFSLGTITTENYYHYDSSARKLPALFFGPFTDGNELLLFIQVRNFAPIFWLHIRTKILPIETATICRYRYQN